MTEVIFGKDWISERNRKVAVSRWEKVERKALSALGRKEKQIEFKLLKAKILGFLAGDGSISIRREKNHLHYDIAFYPDHKSMAQQFVDAFEKLYEKRPAIKSLGRYFSVRIADKAACKDLLNTAKFGILNWRMPVSYLNLPELQIEWLRAFFDCEGSVSNKRISLQSVNKKGLSEVQLLLRNLKVHSTMYSYERKNKKWNLNHILIIQRKCSREAFLNKIGFNHAAKQEKLKRSLAH